MTALGQIEFFDEVAQLDWAQMAQHVDRFLGRIGVDYYSFLPIRKGNWPQSVGLSELRTNYKSDWVERYRHRAYNQVDPVCDLASRARNPFYWGTEQFLGNFRKHQRQVFYEAREFGIRYGISFPIKNADGGLALVSFSSDSRGQLNQVVRAHGALMHMAAHQISDNLMEPQSRAIASAETQSPLSARERETLNWVVQGLTSEEIADRMFLSVSAVTYHLGNATRKLNARNRHHAAFVALAHGYI